MILSVISIGFICLLSLGADRAPRRYPQLPMQIALNGRPVWGLPRRGGMVVTPVLTILMLGLVLLVSDHARAQGSGTALASISIAVPIVHVLHLCLANRVLERARRS